MNRRHHPSDKPHFAGEWTLVLEVCLADALGYGLLGDVVAGDLHDRLPLAVLANASAKPDVELDQLAGAVDQAGATARAMESGAGVADVGPVERAITRGGLGACRAETALSGLVWARTDIR